MLVPLVLFISWVPPQRVLWAGIGERGPLELLLRMKRCSSRLDRRRTDEVKEAGDEDDGQRQQGHDDEEVGHGRSPRRVALETLHSLENKEYRGKKKGHRGVQRE